MCVRHADESREAEGAEEPEPQQSGARDPTRKTAHGQTSYESKRDQKIRDPIVVSEDRRMQDVC